MAFTLCILTSGCLLLNSSATTGSRARPQYMASVSSLSCPPPILSRNTDTGFPNGDTPAMAAMSLPPMPSLLYLSHSSLLSPFVETRVFAFNPESPVCGPDTCRCFQDSGYAFCDFPIEFIVTHVVKIVKSIVLSFFYVSRHSLSSIFLTCNNHFLPLFHATPCNCPVLQR